MDKIFYSLISATVISLASLIGVFSLLIKKQEILNKIVFLFVGFAAGALMGSAFFHLLPESLHTKHNENVFLYLILGFIIFFILERIIRWHHCHKEEVCEIHPFGTLSLIGDGVHNFIDGVIIFAGFSHSIESGVIISFTVLLHEIPQELGDFGVLIYSGYTIKKALLFNLLSALTCILGVIFSFFVFSSIKNFSIILMPFAAGGFLYISASDLIPEIHRQQDLKRSNYAFFMFILGLILMWLLKNLHIHGG